MGYVERKKKLKIIFSLLESKYGPQNMVLLKEHYTEKTMKSVGYIMKKPDFLLKWNNC